MSVSHRREADPGPPGGRPGTGGRSFGNVIWRAGSAMRPYGPMHSCRLHSCQMQTAARSQDHGWPPGSSGAAGSRSCGWCVPDAEARSRCLSFSLLGLHMWRDHRADRTRERGHEGMLLVQAVPVITDDRLALAQLRDQGRAPTVPNRYSVPVWFSCSNSWQSSAAIPDRTTSSPVRSSPLSVRSTPTARLRVSENAWSTPSWLKLPG